MAKCRAYDGRRSVLHDDMQDWSTPRSVHCQSSSELACAMISARHEIDDLIYQSIRQVAGQLSKYFVPIATSCVVQIIHLLARQLGVTLLDGMSIAPELSGNAIQRLWLRLLRHSV